MAKTKSCVELFLRKIHLTLFIIKQPGLQNVSNVNFSMELQKNPALMGIQKSSLTERILQNQIQSE